MAKVGSWSTTPGNNNSTPPDGWPEGQAPSTVNDCGRQMMADLRTAFSDLQYFDANNTPSFLTATTFSLASADVTTFHIGRRVKLYDSTTLYATIADVSSTTVTVQLDNGALTASLSSVAVAIVAEQNSSLPNHVYASRNLIINGNMEIWQRGNSASVVAGVVTYLADRFAVLNNTTAAVNMSRAERSASADFVPTIAQCGQHLTNSLRVSVSAADAVTGATQYAALVYRMEGYDWRQIAHRPNILSFWVRTNRTGTYAVSLRNSSASVSFVQNYTVTAANAWSRFNVTVDAAPTTSEWNYSNGVGLVVNWNLACGTTYQAAAGGNWTAGEFLATTSQTNFVASAGNVFMLTGVTLRGGTQALPLEIRPYGEELAMCQRYYWRGLPCATLNFGAYTVGALGTWACAFPVTMRDVPTLAVSFGGITAQNLIGNPTATGATIHGFKLIASASAAGVNTNFAFGASDFIEASTEF